MPHAFWHQWGDERTEQERLQEAALERIANLDEYGTTDPSIWDKYIVRDQLAGGERRLDRAGQALGQVASALGSVMEPVSEHLFKPMMGEVARDIPVTWTPEGDVPTPWTEQIGLTQDDRPTSVGDTFKEFIRNVPVGPTTLGMQVAPLEEAFNKQILPRADTTREQKISQEATRREQETGVPVTQKERREISQEEYPLPPYVLGTLEEAPWFAIPEAGLARRGLAAARTGQALSSAGRLGPAAPVARAGLRTAEAALKPIEAVETIAARTIGAPIQLLGKGVRFGLSPINRRLTESRLKEAADQVNEMVDISSSGAGGQVRATGNVYDTGTGEIIRQYTPKEGLDALNQMTSLRLGIEKPLFHLVGNKVTRNPLEKLPTNVNMNWQPNAKSEAAFDRLFPRLSEEEIAQRMRRPVRTEPDNLPEPVTNQEMVPESTVFPKTARTAEEFSVLDDSVLSSIRRETTEAAIESPVTIDVMGGRSREIIPSPTEAQPAATAARRAATESGQTHQAIEDVGRSGVLSSKVDDIGGAEQIALETKGLSPGAADFYVKLMFSMHDSTFALRVLQDNYFRSLSPHASFRPGSHRDVVSGVILSSGAPIRGMRMYENFIKSSIEPKLGRTKEEIAAGVESSVEQWHIERYIQSKHWLDIENNIGRENMPNVYDPRPKLDANGKPTKEVIGEVSSENYKSWVDDIKKELTGPQFARVKEGAEAVRDVYARMRIQLRDEGILSSEQFIAMQDNYEWYNPIDYVEYNDVTQVARSMPIINTGIYGFTDNPAVMQAMPPLGETLARRFISHELRIHRNRVNKAFVEMGLNSKIGLVDATDELTQVTSFKKYLDKEGNWQEAPVFGKADELYDDRAGTGYLSFYENGERKLYGMRDAKGKMGFVDKVWWDAVNGRAGLGVRGTHEVENIFALANSFFKSTYTTWDPLFMIGNGLIDQLVVALKYRVMPTTVWWRLTSSIYRNLPALGIPRTGIKTPAISGREGAQVLDFKAFASGDIKGGFVIGSEDRFRELMQLSGGYQNAYFNAQQISRQIQREINQAGHVGAEVIQPTQMTKLRDSLADGARKYFPVPVVGEYVEQAPRLLVAQKSFKKLVGNEEWKRLMKLSRDEWEEELYRSWKGTGKGLLDSPEARQSSINALESTINFFRGGDRIRRWNNYVMFLNAAFEGAKLPFRMLGVDVHPNIQPVEGARAGERLFKWGDFKSQLGKRRGQTGKYDAPLGPEIMGKQLDPRLAAATTVGMAVSSYAGLQLAYNFQHEEYWDIPTYIRYNSIIIMQPAERDEDGNKIVDPNTGRPVPNYITVPHRTRELSLFFGTTTYLLESGFTENPTDWTLFAKQIWKSSSPINDTPLPELLNIGIEEFTGYDMYRMEPIVNEDYAHLPPEEQYNQYTSEAARIIGNRLGEELPWAPDMAKSPQRLEHMYESATGGIGRRVKDGTDYTILLFEDLYKNEKKPMSEKANNYRKMPRLERREFLASLTADERIQFDKEIRKPSADFEGSAVTNILDAVWASTGVEQRFGPDRAGGLREISQLSAEREIPGVTAKESSAASSKLREVKREVFATQQESDKNLGQWMQAGGMSGLSPEEWREERKDKWKVIEGAELLTKYMFPKAVQGKDPAIKQQWYDAIYNAAGTMPDIRSQGDLLVAGYYNITSPEDDPTRTWSDYFNDRDTYVTSIQERADAAGNPQIFEEFSRALTANLTDTETVYNTASKYLSNYWDIGSDINHIFPNASATAPELAQLWETYLNADYGTQRTMRDRNRQLDTLVQRRSQLRKQVVMDDYHQNGYGYMDSLLAFWYGSFYKPITPQGKEIHSRMYGGAGSSRLPFTPEEQPLRLR